MADARRRFPYLGAYLCGIGLVVAGLGAAPEFHEPILSGFAGENPQSTLYALAALLLGVGVIFIAFSLKRAPMDSNLKPAHVAFMERPESARDDEVLVRVAKVVPRQDVRAPEVAHLDEAIREVNHRIHRAMVMLGTGKLSGEGYTAYVEELKKTKAGLEAQRIRFIHANR